MLLSFQSQGRFCFFIWRLKENKKGEIKYEAEKNLGIGKKWPNHRFEGSKTKYPNPTRVCVFSSDFFRVYLLSFSFLFQRHL